MSRAEMVAWIEQLRSQMNSLADAKANYDEILKVSQQLDELIVMYYGLAS